MRKLENRRNNKQAKQSKRAKKQVNKNGIRMDSERPPRKQQESRASFEEKHYLRKDAR